MPARPFMYRSARAREQLELFLLSAVSSLLLVRFYLYLTGYPQVGSGRLHIAHVLFGGLLMLAALTITLSFLGSRVQRTTALLGGVGFGIFIDEIGKLITRDNNYFFRPAIGIIYAIFAVLYLLFNFLARDSRLTSKEYQLNALAELEEAVAHDMDPAEKARVLSLLAAADQASPITTQLKRFVASVETVAADQPGFTSRFRSRIDELYQQFWSRHSSRGLVRTVSVLAISLFVIGILGTVYANANDILQTIAYGVSYSYALLAGQLLASITAAGFAIAGVALLSRSPLSAFEQFRRAVLVNIFLTEFFLFSREQFSAAPGFILNLGLLLLINFVLYQEHRLKRPKA